MPATCVFGLQWGDEAKGKIVDFLTERHDLVVRYQGGPNAGHTVVAHGKKYKLSLVPSGVLRSNVQCVVTGGVVLHPGRFLGEIDLLRSQGVEIGANLRISDRAHVIFPWHTEEERVAEARAGGGSIGTTMRGIGPCYRDKAGRTLAVRMGDMYRSTFAAQVEKIVVEKNIVLKAQAEASGLAFQPLKAEAVLAEYLPWAERLKPHVGETTQFLHTALEQGKKLLFEGAQGSLLDVDHGTFPFVTSSNSSGAGVSSGSGVPGKYFERTLGVAKAYTSRVGAGAFPTEDFGAIGERIRTRGNEFGTVTGRPRRCGWFDAVAVRYAARIGGVDRLCVMLLDVLSGFDELKICTAYDIDGRRTSDFPSHADDLARAVPVYETLPGWKEEITDRLKLADLPVNARKYLDRLGELVGRTIGVVSVGPDRQQTMILDI